MKSKNLLTTFIFFTICICFFGLGYIFYWPGLWISDTFVNYESALKGEITSWVSVIYSFYLVWIHKLSQGLGTQAFMQVLVAGICLSRFFYVALESGFRKRIGFWILLVFAIPLNYSLVLFINRDFWAGWIHLLLAFELYVTLSREYYSKQPMTPWRYSFLFCLLLVASSIRTENVILAPIFFFLIFYFGGFFSRKRSMQFLMCLSMLVVTWFLAFNQRVTHPIYRVTSLVNPMSYILKHGGESAVNSTEKKVVSQVIPYEDMINYQNNFEIDPFHRSSKSITQVDYDNFRSFYVELVKRNMPLFFENRAIFSAGLMGITANTMYIMDDFYVGKYPKANEIRSLVDAPPKNPFKIVPNNFKRNLRPFFRSDLSRLVFGSCLLPIFITIFLLVKFRSFPLTSAASFFIACRVPIVLLAAPAAQYKYLYSFHFSAFLLVLIFLMEIKFKRNFPKSTFG